MKICTYINIHMCLSVYLNVYEYIYIHTCVSCVQYVVLYFTHLICCASLFTICAFIFMLYIVI